jgi:outer membrane protein OmpA-like peptidoglycan-associated protein
MDASDDSRPAGPEICGAVAGRLAKLLAECLAQAVTEHGGRHPLAAEIAALEPRQNQILTLVESLLAQKKSQDGFWGDIAGANQRFAELERELTSAQTGTAQLRNALEAGREREAALEREVAAWAGRFRALDAEKRELEAADRKTPEGSPFVTAQSEKLAGLERELAHVRIVSEERLAAWEAETERASKLELDLRAGAARQFEASERNRILEGELARTVERERLGTAALREELGRLGRELAGREALCEEERSRIRQLEADIAQARERNRAAGENEVSGERWGEVLGELAAEAPPVEAVEADRAAIFASAWRRWVWLAPAALALILAVQNIAAYQGRSALNEPAPARNFPLAPEPKPLDAKPPVPVDDPREALSGDVAELKKRLAALNTPPDVTRDEANASLASILQKFDAPESGDGPASEPGRAQFAPLRETIAFPLGMVDLPEEQAAAVRDVAARLRQAKAQTVLVLGYTDESPPRRDLRKQYRDNDAVSRARAAVVGGLLVQAGIDSATVVTHGLGAQRPVAANDSPENRAKNRRVEIIAF